MFSLSCYAQVPKPTVPAGVNAPNSSDALRFPVPEGFVNDYSKVLEQAAKSKMEQTLRDFQISAKIDIAVAIVDSTGEESTFDHSLAMSREWKIGSENGGALLFLAVKDRKWHIQIDKKLEQLLTNDEVAAIGAVMLTDLKAKKYGLAIQKCLDKLISSLNEKRSKVVSLSTQDSPQSVAFGA
jgi:uncharacterized membrane protein YgcG